MRIGSSGQVDPVALGQEAHDLAKRLWPITRSITGRGVRATFDILQEELPSLKRHSIASGTDVFDWTIPPEWNVEEAYILTPEGEKICDLSQNNLHLVGYSTPVDGVVSLEELQEHLYSLPDQPTAIPYITSYYKERWGFCISQNQREMLKPGNYRVVIKSELAPGQMDWADLVIPGESDEEIFFSTYICHPSMANNELSGPIVAHALAKVLQSGATPRYTYRFAFVPETIGAILYTHQNFTALRSNVKAGFVLTCCGDEGVFSYLPSRKSGTLADRAALTALNSQTDVVHYSFLERGSDERQYCSPNVDLPMCSVMRSKYAIYPQYHTSLDDLEFVTPKGLADTIACYLEIIGILESNVTPTSTVTCEPCLGKRDLYPTLSQKGSSNVVRNMINFLAYCDGELDLMEISDVINLSYGETYDLYNLMKQNELISTARP